MAWEYTDHYTNSGMAGNYAEAQGNIDAWAPKKGRFFRQLMRDPMNSSLGQGFTASLGSALKGFDESFTYDPALPPELVAQQMNKGKQAMTSQAQSGFIQNLAQLQAQLYALNQRRKMGIFGAKVGTQQSGLDAQGRMMQAQNKPSFWGSLLKIGLPIAMGAMTGGIGALGGTGTWGGALAGAMGKK